MTDLNPGDFIYQSDQELFMVLIDETTDTYKFAVHGWREIDKDRIDGYLNRENTRVHSEREIDKIVDESNNTAAKQNLKRLKTLFNQYKDISIGDDSEYSEFSMEE